MSDGGELTIHIDGAARGNPGPAAFAYVIAAPGGPVVEHAETLGTATNNVAEYTALVRVLGRAAELGGRRLVVHSDSELMVKQMNGEYRVKNAELRDLYEEASALARHFERVTIRHVRREQNKRADELCNLALDGKLGRGGPPARARASSAAASSGGLRSRVDADAVACLAAAAAAWARGDATRPDPAAVWEQLWSVLEEGGVLKKVKPV
jgi:ribonuclease HI